MRHGSGASHDLAGFSGDEGGGTSGVASAASWDGLRRVVAGKLLVGAGHGGPSQGRGDRSCS